MNKLHKGFTLTEITIVVGAIAILSGAFIFNIAPRQSIANAVDAAEVQVAEGIESAINVYMTNPDENGKLGDRPVDKPVPTGIENAVDICARDASDVTNCFEMAPLLEAGEFIKELPSRASEGDDRSGYSLYLDETGSPQVIPYATNEWTAYSGSQVPSCADQSATIYVDETTGKIVGGPSHGDTYLGELIGTNGNDVIVGTEGIDNIDGGRGDDVICSGGGNDVIGSGGGSGTDILIAGAGNDIIGGGPGPDIICAGSGNDTIDGGDGDDQIDGYTQDSGTGDIINGGFGSDNCYNGEEEDGCESDSPVSFCEPFQEEEGEILFCNEDAFCTSYDWCIDESTHPLGAHRCYTNESSAESYLGFSRSGIQNCQCDGARTCSPWGWCQGTSRPDGYPETPASSSSASSASSVDDGSRPSCGADPADIWVNADNKIVGGSNHGAEYTGTLTGGAGIDRIVGTDGPDIIDGGDGNDIICGRGGNDEITGGGNGNDIMYGEGGNDTLNGNNGNDFLYGGDGEDIINGGNGNDTIDGQGDNDEIDGGTGKDNINGGLGNDTIYGANGKDTIEGSNGDDTIYGGNGKDNIDAGGDTDWVDGGSGTDTCLNAETTVSCP